MGLTKVLFVIGSLSGGGAERVLSIISSGMAERGVRVRICCVSPLETKPAYGISEKIEYRPLFHYGENKRFNMPAIMRALRREARGFQPDVIVGFMNYNATYAIVSCLGLGIPVVYRTAANLAWDMRSFPVRFGVRFLYPLFARGGVYQHDEQLRDYKPSKRRKDAVIMNPIAENDHWKKEKDYGQKRIVASGRLIGGKNFSLLLKAFARIRDEFPDWTIDLYGDGPLREKLEREIISLGLQRNVFLRGFTNDMQHELFRASLYVMTSDTEGMPNALMEALAMGCASISTDFDGGAAGILIENGVTGIVIPKGNDKKLSAALFRLLSDEQLRRTLGEAAAADIRTRADKGRIVDKWIRFLEDVADSSRKW